MEDEDDFGDLYTDVLPPFSAQFQPQRNEAAGKAAETRGRPIDLNINSDDEEILYGAPDLKDQNKNLNLNSNPYPYPSSTLDWNLNGPVREEKLAESRGFDLNLRSNSETLKIDGLAGTGGDGLGLEARVLEMGEGVKMPLKTPGESSFMLGDDDDDINIVLEDREDKDVDLVEKQDNFGNKDDAINFVNESVNAEIGFGQMIPGFSGRLENPRGPNVDDEWESEDSEDDLQIVLNDNHGPMAIERMIGMIDEDDEDGEPLVIVADNGDVGHHPHQPQMMEEPVWGGEEGGPEAVGEKDLSDATKAIGGGVASTAVQPKVAYNNHAYHHPFHSQFKYVRPGAAPLPAAAPGGIPGQVRPPVSAGPLAARGRGDWQPAGIKGSLAMQKGFHPGYGRPAWGANSAGRGYGSGLDFTLPSHKTIFEVDIDGFEDKPWKLPGIDVSDFFNFGLNEDSWKGYCKQLEQLRLETTMQSKIRVYESGRAEKDYDPDLPPELAAAVGIQDIPSENANPGKADAGLTDLARDAHGRPPLPVGKPIPVETCSGDRLPSIDTRRPRLHDTDAIIEIVCHSSTDGDDMEEQQDNDPSGKDLRGGETDDDKDDTDSFSPSHNGQKREAESRRAQLKNADSDDETVGEDILRFPEGVHRRGREIGLPFEERSTKGRGHVRSLMDDQNEESIHSGDDKLSPTLSSPRTIESGEEQALVVGNEINDGSVMDDRSSDMGREDKAVDSTTVYACEDENLKFSIKKQKLRSQAGDDGEARSASSKDHRRVSDDVEDEVYQEKHPHPAVTKKQVGDEDSARRKGRYERDETERQNGHRKSESADWRKESDVSEGSWHRGDEDYGRRIRVEDPRKREHSLEIGSRNRGKFKESDKSEKDERHQSRNQLDNGSWRGANRDHDSMGSRQRDRDNNINIRNERVDDLHSKRRKEEAHKSREHSEKDDHSRNHRESSSRRKRDRGDGSDQLRRDEHTRLQDDDGHYARQKQGGSFQRERSERQRERDEYRIKQDDVSSRREREETRPVMRTGRAVEDKTWSHSRGKDNYKGSDREYNPKDVARHGDQFKRRDRVDNGIFSQQKGHEDTYARGNQLGNDDKKARYRRPSSHDGPVAYGSDTYRVIGHKRKEGSRKNKESQSGDHSFSVPSKKNYDGHGGQISETVNLRSRSEQQRGEVHVNNNQSSRKLREEEASSDDEDSRKGRSKLERWMSHQERDLNITSLKSRDVETHKSRGAYLEESSKKVEDSPQSLVDEKDSAADINNVNPNKHLDTVEKLKKRSERFKLPMPSEKETVAIKKMESEPLPVDQPEVRQDSEIKPERPARKRRWTGN